MRLLNKMLLIYWSIVLLMLLFTAQTNFNLIGFNFNYDDGMEVLTIEEGYFNNEYHKVQVNEDNTATAIRANLSISNANQIWKANIYILPIFAAFLFLFFNKSFRQTTKFFKWYILIYILSFIIFIIWNFNVNHNAFQEVVHYLNDFKR